MSRTIITKVIDEMNELPDDLQEQVLNFVVTLRQRHLQTSGNAWDVLEALTGTVDAPAGWSTGHDHYIYDLPKQ